MQYLHMFGRYLLAGAEFQQGETTWKGHLPKSDWRNFRTRQIVQSHRRIGVDALLNRARIFVKVDAPHTLQRDRDNQSNIFCTPHCTTNPHWNG